MFSRRHLTAPLLIALLGTTAGLAQTSPPPASFPKSLEEAAKQFDPTKPTTPTTTPVAPPTTTPTTPTTPPPTTTAPPAAAASGIAGEPAEVDGWTLVEARGPRRAKDGSETMDACGYERDVVVSRTKGGKTEMTPAKLVMPCTKGADGLPAPGTPALQLPAPYALPPMAMLGVDVELGVTGDVRNNDVANLIVAHKKELEACHTAGKGGNVVVRVVIGAGGKVSEAGGQSGPLKGSLTDSCATAAMKSWTWPAPGDGHPAVASVGLTYSDKPAGATAAAAPTGPVAPTCKPGEKPKKPEELAKDELACVPPKKAPVARACAPDEQPKKAEDLKPGELACKVEQSERGVPFLKGELTHLGDVQLVNARTSFGVGLGLNVIDNVYFGVVRPDLNLKFGDFGLGLGAPLRFEIADLNNIDVLAGDPVGDVFGELGRFRTEDWDQIEDFLRPLRYLTYGKKEDHFYVDVNRVHAVTVGHGQLVRRYNPNLDIDEDNLFATVDGYGDYGGVELMGGPFPLPRLIGGLAFIKPMGIVSGIAGSVTDDGSYADMVADSWSIGASYVTDLNSPTGLLGRRNPADQRRQLLVDSANQLVWTNKINPVGDVVQGIGFDTEVKVLKVQNVDIKVYGDYSHLFFPADSSGDPEAAGFDAFDGGGGTVGGLLRVSLGETPVRPIEEEDDDVKAGRKPREKKAAHAFRVRLEGRAFQPTYLPSYFNTMYEVDRFQFGFGENRATLPTKIGYLASQQDDPLRLGYYVEASYDWVDAIAFTAAFEDAYALGGDDEAIRAKNLALHVESQGLGWVQLFASYHFRNFDGSNVNELFSFNTDNEILFAGARLQVLPIMFINVAAQRSFRLGFDDDDTPGVVDSKGNRFSSIGLENVWAGGFDVELGWQF